MHHHLQTIRYPPQKPPEGFGIAQRGVTMTDARGHHAYLHQETSNGELGSLCEKMTKRGCKLQG